MTITFLGSLHLFLFLDQTFDNLVTSIEFYGNVENNSVEVKYE